MYRSDNAMIAGVVASIAEYLKVDASLLRIVAIILFVLLLGTPFLLYLLGILLIPRRPLDVSRPIEVKPSASGELPVVGRESNQSSQPTLGAVAPESRAAYFASSGTTAAVGPAAFGAAPSLPVASNAAVPYATTPGAGWVSSNSEAFDAVDPDKVTELASLSSRLRRSRGLSAALMLGLMLLATGLLALFAWLFNPVAWQFWPMVLVLGGLLTLFTPGYNGWSVSRAGYGILIITAGMTLQFWKFEIFPFDTFVLIAMNFWPLILVVLGLVVLGGALRRDVLKLMAALLMSLTLIMGVWTFGGMKGAYHISLPLIESYDLQLPPSPFQQPD
ncbi:MAG: PspC domain-containing protein [Actinomycetia bacterium]|nr:PspC domain-containing protein [Actinomycetes bacterium]